MQAANVQAPRKELVFTSEIIKEISPGSPANHRLNTIRDLCEKVETRRLEQVLILPLFLDHCEHSIYHLMDTQYQKYANVNGNKKDATTNN